MHRFALGLAAVFAALPCFAAGQSANLFSAPFSPQAADLRQVVLSYSSYLGSPQRDHAARIALDAAGNVYIAGVTGDFDKNVFVAKYDPARKTLLYFKEFRGSGEESITAFAVEPSGSVLIAGRSTSTDLPVTSNLWELPNRGAFLARLNTSGDTILLAWFGGVHVTIDALLPLAGGSVILGGYGNAHAMPVPSGGIRNPSSFDDGYLARLSPQNALETVVMTPVRVQQLAAAPDGSVLSAGPAHSAGYQPGFTVVNPGGLTTSGVALARWHSTLSAMLSGSVIAGLTDGQVTTLGLDAQANVYLAGSGAGAPPLFVGASETKVIGFVAKLSSDGKTLLAARFLPWTRLVRAGVTEPSGRTTLVATQSYGLDAPLTTDAFSRSYGDHPMGAIVRYEPDLATVSYGTYFGSTVLNTAAPVESGFHRDTTLEAAALDASGGLWITGTTSSGLPLTRDAAQPTPDNPSYGYDAFLARFDLAATQAPTFTASEDTVEFQTTAANPTAESRTLSITAASPVSFRMAVYATSSAGWLRATVNQTTTPATLTITADPSLVPAGIHKGAVLLTGAGALGGLKVIPVVLRRMTPLVTSPTQLVYNLPAGAGQSVQQLGFAGNVLSEVAILTSSPWLSVRPSGILGVFAVTVDPAGLPQGTHTATITFRPVTAPEMALVVPVTLYYGQRQLTVSRTSLTMIHPPPVIFSAPFEVRAVGGELNFQASTPPSTPWITIDNPNLTTPATVSATINLATAAQGVYTSTITLRSPDSLNTIEIPIRITIGPRCAVTFNPSQTTFPAAGGTRQVVVSLQGLACPNTVAITGPAENFDPGPVWLSGSVTTTGAPPDVRATFTLNAAPNTAAVPRVAYIPANIPNILGVAAHQLAPGASSCATADQESTVRVPAAGARLSLDVRTATGCQWTTSHGFHWVQPFPLQGTDSGRILYTVHPNFTPVPRTSWVQVDFPGGHIQRVNIVQDPAAGDAAQRLAAQLYWGALGRHGSDAEVAFQAQAIRAGLPLTFVLSTFFDAQEFHATSRFVVAVYTGLLGRNPDYSGWLFQRSALTRGDITDTEMVRNVLDSAEWTLINGRLTDDQFIRFLYRQILNRVPAAAELEFHLGTLARFTRPQVASNFLLVPEFRARTQNRATLWMLYAALLHRDPTPFELARDQERVARDGTPWKLAQELWERQPPPQNSAP